MKEARVGEKKDNMQEEIIEEAFEERTRWLAEMGSKEEWVLRDRENNQEFIFSASEDEDGEEHLTKIMLPYTIQKFTILGHN